MSEMVWDFEMVWNLTQSLKEATATIAEKDAEIERLGELLTGADQLWSKLKDQDAEIERLKKALDELHAIARSAGPPDMRVIRADAHRAAYLRERDNRPPERVVQSVVQIGGDMTVREAFAAAGHPVPDDSELHYDNSRGWFYRCPSDLDSSDQNVDEWFYGEDHYFEDTISGGYWGPALVPDDKTSYQLDLSNLPASGAYSALPEAVKRVILTP